MQNLKSITVNVPEDVYKMLVMIAGIQKTDVESDISNLLGVYSDFYRRNLVDPAAKALLTGLRK